MRQSHRFGITLKDAPKDAQSPAQRLLLRAGYIRQAAAGVYVIMPYLLRVLNKLAQMCRVELNACGFEELALPLLQPRTFWEEPETGETGGHAQGAVYTFRDRRGSNLGIGAGGDQVLAAVAAKEIRSYKDLPKGVFQIEKQVRDDPGPRTALFNDREFLSLDAFSFDADQTGAGASYQTVGAAFDAVCRLAGLSYRRGEADLGAEAACNRHALVALADSGDDAIVVCDACGYAATAHAGRSRLEVFPQEATMKAMQAVHGPGLIGVGPLAEFLGIPVWKTTKTLVFQADDRVVAVMVRGDCDVNEPKVQQHLNCRELTLASPEVVRELTGAEVGYAGGIGLPDSVIVLADYFTRERVNFECGANRTDYHNINVNWERDLPMPTFGDFKTARTGELCARCDHGRLRQTRGIGIGSLAQLGASASAQSALAYQDKAGAPQPVFRGFYRLNLSRLAGAVVEQHHDEAGIRWPSAVAPFQVHLIGLNLEDEALRSEAEKLYRQLLEEKFDVLFDDRDARAGEKFSDSDLLGIPLRLTLSKRTLKEGKLELKLRARPGSELVTPADALSAVRSNCQRGPEGRSSLSPL
ncbi:MAG: proline--tRNA ligase [Hyphomicrobiales bacterium]